MGVFDKEEYIDRLIKAYITYPISQADVPKEKRSDKCIVFREDLENLINKYKEQKRDIRASHILLAKYSQKNEEQEKTIQLMSEELAELNYEYCGIWCEGKKCKEYYENHFINEESCNGNKLTCIIDYFKKKARTSNDKL